MKKTSALFCIIMLAALSIAGCDDKDEYLGPIDYTMPLVLIEFCGEGAACVKKEVRMSLPVDSREKAMFLLEQFNKTIYTQEKKESMIRSLNISHLPQKEIDKKLNAMWNAEIPGNETRHCFFNEGERCWYYLQKGKLNTKTPMGSNYWITGEIAVKTGKIKEVSAYSGG